MKRLVQFLDDSGLRDNIILVYQSDNGHSVKQRAHNGGGNRGPYRGAKFSLFEGGIRFPAIISWPGHLPEGGVRAQLAHSCDSMPTLAELCNVSSPQSDLSGLGLVPVIQSATDPSPHAVLRWRSGKQWAGQGPWKLLHNPDGQADARKLAPADKEWFLANVDDDPGEQMNLAQRHPEIVEQLRQLESSKNSN